MNLYVPGQLSNVTRDLCLCVWDHDDRTLPHLHMICNLFRRDEVLAWLVNNRKTGKEFMALYNGECDGSLTRMISIILQKINKDLEPKPIIFGRDINEG